MRPYCERGHGDDTDPADGVTDEINAVKPAGFPVPVIALPGQHCDPDDPAGDTGTDNDLRRHLLRTSMTDGCPHDAGAIVGGIPGPLFGSLTVAAHPAASSGIHVASPGCR